MSEKKEWNTGELLSTSSAYWRDCALQAGVRLGVFTVLGEERKTAEAVSLEIGADSRGMETLLNALSALGLLIKENGSYSNTGVSAELLVKNSQKYIGYIILHHHHILDGWAQLHEAVKTGKPVEMRSYGEDTERESFLMGMFNLAMGIAPKLASRIDLTGRKNLLDLGGGPGTYSIHFCLKNHGLSAMIYDRQTTEPFAMKTVKKFGLEGRIGFMGGDFTQDRISGTYDVAWLSHILHSNGPEECRGIIQKTVSAMEPGGLIMIHEFILDNSKDSPLFPALFSLNMLINNSGGRSYSEEEISGMLEESGVRHIKRLDFIGPSESGILYGTV